MPPRSRNPKVVDDSSTLKILVASSPSSPFRLGDLPPEIRILIFTEYLVWRWQARGMTYGSGKKEFNTPELIIALRADPKMYTEALDVYFDNCTFTISSNNEARFRYMARGTLRRVRSLEIWYGLAVGNPVWKLELSTSFPVNILLHCTSVKRIVMNTGITTFPGRNWPATLRDMVKQVIVQLPQLQVLTLVIPRPWHHHEVSHLWEERVESILLPICQATKIQHSNQCKDIQPRSRERFTWDAGRGRTLTWTDGSYWRSIPWDNITLIYVTLTKFHDLRFWIRPLLHFVGLNPRPMLFYCADKTCGCTAPGRDWRISPISLSPSLPSGAPNFVLELRQSPIPALAQT